MKNVQIADLSAGKGKVKVITAENLNTYFPNLNCSYHRFTPTSPDNIELGNLKNDLEPLVFYFQEKLATLINLVETDYVVLDDNDNFYALDDFKKNNNSSV